MQFGVAKYSFIPRKLSFNVSGKKWTLDREETELAIEICTEALNIPIYIVLYVRVCTYTSTLIREYEDTFIKICTVFFIIKVFRLLSSSLLLWLLSQLFGRYVLRPSCRTRSTPFIESTGIACSDSVSHKQVQVLNIPVLLFAYSQD